MKDSALQIGSGVGDAAPSSELTERILRRSAESLGVIDVRRPQQQYARTAGWVAQRFALLDHWRSRYLSAEDAPAHGASFVFAAQSQAPAGPGQALSSPIQLARMARQSVPSQPGANGTTSPPELFRVRRRGVSPQTEASVDAQPISAPSAEGAAATFDSSGGSNRSVPVARSQVERAEWQAVEVPSIARQATPPHELILPKRLSGGIETELETAIGAERLSRREEASHPAEIEAKTPTGSATGETDILHHRVETPVDAAPAQLLVGVNHVEANSSSRLLRVLRKASKADTGLAGMRESTAPDVAAAPAQTLTERRAFEIASTVRQVTPTTTELILPKRLGGSIETESETARETAIGAERLSRREEASHPAEIEAKTPTGSRTGETGIPYHRVETPVDAGPTQLPVGVNRVEANSSSRLLRVQRRASGANTDLARGQELTASDISAALTQMPLAKSSAGHSPSSASQLREPSSSPEGGSPVEVTNSFVEHLSSMGTGALPAKIEAPVPLPLIQRRPVGVLSAGGTASREVVERRAEAAEIRTAEITDLFAEQTGSMGTGASPAKVGAQVPFPLIRRSPAGISSANGSTSRDATERRLVAKEIRSARGDTPEPAMVWRKSAEGSLSSDRATAGSEALRIARRTTTAEPTPHASAESSQSATSMLTMPPTKEPASKLDVARLAEQVSRLLARQLAVERERRGRREWN
jgi:hypothetical protein